MNNLLPIVTSRMNAWIMALTLSAMWRCCLIRPTPSSGFVRVPYSTRPTARFAKRAFEQGDSVQFPRDGRMIQGIIQEKRSGGWYAVQLGSNEEVKIRSTQLQLLQGEPEATRYSSREISESIEIIELPAVPPPTIYDLDALMGASDPVRNKRDQRFIEQCHHHASYTKWVMFTDLHCSTSSIDTCLKVLEFVHRTAVERNAGVLFLGDWWHHRGTLRVDLLNSVLDALSSWKVPLVMIPGNHDQVTLGGHNHGLTPLENAYRVERQGEGDQTQSVAGPLIFSHPTKFAGGFFVPHIRDNNVMESILQSQAVMDATALFVHADVTGASMNDLIISVGGVAPNRFPANKPIYSGHFHKPHSVKSRDVVIQYVGSPYQTDMSELGQEKALWVLDASNGWTCTEKIPLDIGRKHFKAGTLSELLKLVPIENGQDGVVGRGDRVVVTICKENLEEIRRLAPDGELSLFDRHVKELRKIGGIVEVREFKGTQLEAINSADKLLLEEMSPNVLLTSFLADEQQRKSLTNSTADDLLRAGLVLMDELEMEENALSIRQGTANFTNLVLEGVSIEGFGPFKDKLYYPLNNRGLVLVRGRNKDGGSDSNGTGKSSLTMATLWALTGLVDSRPMSDAKVADIVNDNVSSAKVSIRGTLNGKSFIVSRTKTSTKTALVFSLDGIELTTQSAKETQQIIDEKLGVSPQILARTMFHGQHALNGLLEATDAKLKEELSLIVPTELWQSCAKLARSKGLVATKAIAELNGMLRLREGDLEILQGRLDSATRHAALKRKDFHERRGKELNLCDEAESVSTGKLLSEFSDMVEVLSAEIKSMEGDLERAEINRHAMLAVIEGELDTAKKSVSVAQQDLQKCVREVDRASINVELAGNAVLNVNVKWNLNTSYNGDAIVSAPDLCPTCNQPLSDGGEGHTHADMSKLIQEEIESGMFAIQNAKVALEQEVQAMDKVNATCMELANEVERLLVSFESTKEISNGRIRELNRDLATARSDLAAKTQQLSKAALKVQQRSIDASFSAELKAVEALEVTCQGLQADCDEAVSVLADLRKQSEVQRLISVSMEELSSIFGPRGIQMFVLQHTIEVLQTISQSYLDELSGGTQRLEISLDESDRILRRAFLRSPNGQFIERPMSSLSGGQWRRCSLALTLGFADLVARRGKMRSSLLVLDEPLTHLDRSGRSNVGKLLRKLLQHRETIGELGTTGFAATTILIILQDLAAEELEESFDRIDEVVKDGGFSFVSVDETS